MSCSSDRGDHRSEASGSAVTGGSVSVTFSMPLKCVENSGL